MYIELKFLKGNDIMEQFCEYIETKIFELSEKEKNLAEAYRQDDAVFVKIEKNVYDICKTVFGVFKNTKPKESFYEEYLKKLDEFEKVWSDSAEKAKQFSDLKKAAAEEVKLSALENIRKKFIEHRGE